MPKISSVLLNLCFLLIFFISSAKYLNAQKISAQLGTDIPYQHYIGVNLEIEKVDFSYRTGILIPPYSNTILDIIEGLGTAEIYIRLLESSYDFGWMNSLGAYYKFGQNRSWYAGVEFRYDYLTAIDTPEDAVEAATGRNINRAGIIQRELDLELALRMYAVSARVGKKLQLFKSLHHHLKIEVSAGKHLATQSILKGNSNNLSWVNDELDRLLWEDVFRPYGYIGGLGIGYTFTF